MERNLLYHLTPIGNYHRHLHILKAHLPFFNGHKIISVAQGANIPILTQEELEDYLESPKIQIHIVQNHSVLRESISFPMMIDKLKEAADTSTPSMTCFAHSKGVTYEKVTKSNKFSAIECWTNMLYYLTFFHHELHSNILFTNPTKFTSGAFRRHGPIPAFPTLPRNALWHYSGTFYWVNTQSLLKATFKPPRHRYGVEAYPGMLFTTNESACVYGDRCRSLYAIQVAKLHEADVDKRLAEPLKVYSEYLKILNELSVPPDSLAVRVGPINEPDLSKVIMLKDKVINSLSTSSNKKALPNKLVMKDIPRWA